MCVLPLLSEVAGRQDTRNQTERKKACVYVHACVNCLQLLV